MLKNHLLVGKYFRLKGALIVGLRLLHIACAHSPSSPSFTSVFYFTFTSSASFLLFFSSYRACVSSSFSPILSVYIIILSAKSRNERIHIRLFILYYIFQMRLCLELLSYYWLLFPADLFCIRTTLKVRIHTRLKIKKLLSRRCVFWSVQRFLYIINLVMIC